MQADSIRQVAQAMGKPWPASVRSWVGPHPKLGGSLGKFVRSYKGSYAHDQIVKTGGGLLNGGQAQAGNGPGQSQSQFWDGIANATLQSYNKLNNTGYTIAMDWFHITDPASNVSDAQDALGVFLKLLAELITTESIHAAGQFRLDIQTGTLGPPDPRPVFDWTATLAAVSSTQSVTLTVDIVYDHTEQSNGLAIALGILVGLFTAGIGGIIVGVAAGIAVGEIINTDVSNAENNAVLSALGGKWGSPAFVTIGPVKLSLSHPNDKEYILTATYPLTSSAWNGLQNILAAGTADAAAAASLLLPGFN